MYYPPNPWFDNSEWDVPEAVRYLNERWWELLRDWHCITPYSLPPKFSLSILEDTADVLIDLTQGRIKSIHQLDALNDELAELLNSDRTLQQHFPSEIATVQAASTDLYSGAPPAPNDKYSFIKKKKSECKIFANACRRLHHRCNQRRHSESDQLWTGIGGILASEIADQVASASPNYSRLDATIVKFILSCVYRGYDVDYLSTLFDRYLRGSSSMRDGLLHAFRRLFSLQRHKYRIFYILDGAQSAKIESSDVKIGSYTIAEVKTILDDQDDSHESTNGDSTSTDDVEDEETDVESDPDEHLAFFEQGTSQCVVLSIDWSKNPDAGSAAIAGRKYLQEIVDFLDFESPVQKFELMPICLVTWRDRGKKLFSRRHPSELNEQDRFESHEARINPNWSSQLDGLNEAFRWSSVSRREKTPEVSLLASWFAFEFLSGTLERTPVEGIMDYFPKTLAIGNLKRRLRYWWRSLQAFDEFRKNDALLSFTEKRVLFERSRKVNLTGVCELLMELAMTSRTGSIQDLFDAISKSILLRERTLAEGKLFTNPQMLAQSLKEDEKIIRREMQQFLVIRNKLVHRARIDHPLINLVAQRASSRLFDLLEDIARQLTRGRVNNSVGAVLSDYRDTFDELHDDLANNNITIPALLNRLDLA